MPVQTYIFILLQLLVVTYFDLKTRKISNLWVLLNIIIYLFHLFYFSNQYPLVPEHFIFPLGCLFIGFLFFLLNIMGPGDSKYLFSLFLLINKDHQITFFTSLLFTTAIVGSILLLLHTIRNFDKIKMAIMLSDFRQLKGVFGSKYTHAPIIIISWVGFGWKANIISI